MICSANGLPCFKDLIAVLFECFSIISLGYLSCRFKLVSSQAKDLNSYLTNFALPMIIFLNIAQMEFRTINLSFLLCALAAKLLVFLTVTLLTLTISYPTNFGYAGSLSILATQSNDFALGYPLIKLLYGESRPEMLNYLSLMAPIQLLILNPLGIAMLEYQKSKNHRKRSHLKNHDDNNSDSYNNSDNNNHNVRNVKNVSREEDALVIPSGATEEAISKSFPHKFEESCSPTRLLEVADLLISDRSKSCSSPEPPQSINSGIGVSEIASRSREPIADDERRRLKCRQKNARSLALAMPARDMPSPTIQQRSSSTELRRSYSGESSVEAKISSESRYISVDGQRNELGSKTGTPTRESVPYDVTENRTPSGRRTSMVGVETGHKSKLDLGFFKALATNPLILASIIALVVNLTHGPELPKYITRVSNTIAASFAAPALFVVGLSMYGKFELLLRNPRDLLLSSVMVLTKGLLLPCLLRTIALLVMPNFASSEDVPYLVDFAFLYGLLPTAPTACIIAKQYGVLQNVVSISMLLSTIIAGPMTLASSVIINPSSVISVRDLENVITQTMETSSVLTLILAPFTLIAFLKLKNSSLTYRNILHASRHAALNGMKRLLRGNPMRVFVFLLILSQIMIGIGGFLWFFIDTSELSDSPHHPSMQLESRTTTTTTENIGLHNIIDPLEEPSDEFIVPTIATTSETQALHSGRMLLNQRRPWLSDHQLDLGFRTLSLIRYVFSAGGLMMAQFCTLSLVSVIAATKSRGYAAGQRVSELLLKACLTVLVCIIVWLVYDSEQLVHLPVEASLPSSTQSLCVRLLYNVTILAICLPLYALMIRTDNRIREADKKESTKNIAVSALRSSLEPDLQVNTFVKRRFVTSSASLSSEASSAATSNTNLDLTLSSGPYVAVSLDGSASPHAQLMTAAAAPDSLSIILDTKTQEKPIGPVESLALNPDTHIFRPGYESSLPLSPASNDADRLQIKNQIDVEVDNNNNEITPTDREKGCNVSGQNHHHHHHHHHNFTRLGEHEFNQYSILIVFMLINSTLNLFSVAQKLLHEEPAGTFRQIEIIGMAFEFGQGLLMFIVYGTEGLVDQLLCRRAPS